MLHSDPSPPQIPTHSATQHTSLSHSVFAHYFTLLQLGYVFGVLPLISIGNNNTVLQLTAEIWETVIYKSDGISTLR